MTRGGLQTTDGRKIESDLYYSTDKESGGDLMDQATHIVRQKKKAALTN